MFFGTINDDLDLVISVLSNDFSVVAITSQGYLKNASKVGINAFKIVSVETILTDNFFAEEIVCDRVIEGGRGFGKLVPALQLFEWNKYELYYTYKGIEHIALLQVTYPDDPNDNGYPQVIFPPPILCHCYFFGQKKGGLSVNIVSTDTILNAFTALLVSLTIIPPH